MAFETSANRLWKRLPVEDRRIAASALLREPSPEALAATLGAVIRARKLRPQVARALPVEEQARILASVLDPGEPLSGSLLVALHLDARRPLLGAFLDELKLPHQDGVLTEEADSLPPPDAQALKQAVAAVASRFSAGEVRAYLNTLWLQDPDRWEGLAAEEPTLT